MNYNLWIKVQIINGFCFTFAAFALQPERIGNYVSFNKFIFFYCPVHHFFVARNSFFPFLSVFFLTIFSSCFNFRWMVVLVGTLCLFFSIMRNVSFILDNQQIRNRKLFLIQCVSGTAYVCIQIKYYTSFLLAFVEFGNFHWSIKIFTHFEII